MPDPQLRRELIAAFEQLDAQDELRAAIEAGKTDNLEFPQLTQYEKGYAAGWRDSQRLKRRECE